MHWTCLFLALSFGGACFCAALLLAPRLLGWLGKEETKKRDDDDYDPNQRYQ